MYLGIVEAILARLQGNPPTFVPPLPMKPEHIVGGTAAVDATLRPSASVSIVSYDIPIFFLDPAGRDMKQVWPCFTFDILAVTPRFNGESHYATSDAYRGDYFYDPVVQSKVTVTDVDDDGNLVTLTQPAMYRARPVMRPYDFLIEIQALADDDVISAFMVEHVYKNVFDPHDSFIRVPMRDGTYRSWDVLYKGFQDLDSRRAVRSGTPGVERQYSKVWTYNVEGYLDNTDMTELVNATRSRKLSIKSL